MRTVRLLFAAALSVAAIAAAPALAAAAPPANDNYLSSLAIDISEPTVTTQVDTTEATTQPDLFNPSREGQPLGGGAAETLGCKGVGFGKTVWYDLAPEVDTGVQLRATGFQTMAAVYEWNPQDSRITGMIDCSTDVSTQDLVLLKNLKANKKYTIQVGGVGGAGGPLSLTTEFFPDSDADTVLDALDKCPSAPGIERFGGCPPELRARPRLSVDYTPSGVVINRLWVEHAPKGAKVSARCSGCGSQTVKAKKAGNVDLSRFVGRAVSAGKSVEVRVTLARQKTGTYRFGATGKYSKWPIRAGALGATLDRCLNARTSKIERCS